MDAAMLGRMQQHLSSGGQLSDLLPELDPSNPAVGLVSQMLAQRQQRLESQLEQRPEEDADDVTGEAGDLRRESELETQRRAEALYQQERRRSRLERLRQKFEEMDAELRWSRDLLDGLALALGACPTCWGEDPGCRLCLGRGRPGFLAPEPASFHRFVTPALHVQGRRVVPSPATPTAGPIAPERTMP